MNKSTKGKKLPRLRKEKVERLAEEAYITYAKTALQKAAYGNVFPVWDDLFYEQKEAWRQVVKIVHQSVVKPIKKI